MRIDLERLARAIHLDVRHVGDHLYEVEGGSRPHVVDLKRPQECDCEDATFRQIACQHLLAVALLNGDRDCLRTLRFWVPRPGARRLIRVA